MKYDFTSIIDRKGKDSIAVDKIDLLTHMGEHEIPTDFNGDFIPMWVADMSFQTCPTVTEAITQRIQHPFYGYFQAREEYYSSIIKWQEKRHGVTGLSKQCIGYENGVLGGVISALTALISPGDPVFLHSPTYTGFTKSIVENGFKVVLSPLVLDKQGTWRMNYEDMDTKIKENHIHAAVFCSPHNPTGRVWEKSELETAMEIFRKNDVFVISDEIWADIVLDGHKHIPTQTISEDAKMRTVSLYAPSKTFNLAGLVGSYHIIYNNWLQDIVRSKAGKCKYNNMNVLSMHALIGAYQPEGYEWTNELCTVISNNINYTCDYINRYFKGVTFSKPEGTYMIFINCEEWCKAHNKTIEDVLKAGWKAGVGWQDGRGFNGPTHIRMNVALPFTKLQEALDRLNTYVFNRVT